jgi:hypothetical protein
MRRPEALSPGLGTAAPLCREAWCTVAEYLVATDIYALRGVHRELAPVAVADDVWYAVLHRDYPNDEHDDPCGASDSEGVDAREAEVPPRRSTFCQRYTAAEVRDYPEVRVAAAFASLYHRPFAQVYVLWAGAFGTTATMALRSEVAGAALPRMANVIEDIACSAQHTASKRRSTRIASARTALPPHVVAQIGALRDRVLPAAFFYRAQPQLFLARTLLIGAAVFTGVAFVLCTTFDSPTAAARLWPLQWWNEWLSVITAWVPFGGALFHPAGSGREVLDWLVGAGTWRWGDSSDAVAGATAHPVALAVLAAVAVHVAPTRRQRQAEATLPAMTMLVATDVMLAAASTLSRTGAAPLLYAVVTRVLFPLSLCPTGPFIVVLPGLAFGLALLAESGVARLTSLLLWASGVDSGVSASFIVVQCVGHMLVRVVVSIHRIDNFGSQVKAVFPDGNQRDSRLARALLQEVFISGVEAAVFLASNGSLAAVVGWRISATLVQYGVALISSYF